MEGEVMYQRTLQRSHNIHDSMGGGAVIYQRTLEHST
jgi:hypothetical protein